MRTEPHQIEVRIVRLSIDENEVGPDMAVPVIAPFAGQRMIEVSARQRNVRHEQPDDLGECSIKLLAVPSRLFALVVALEAIGISNCPHSGSPTALLESSR